MAGLDKYIEEYNKSKGGTGTSSSQDEEKNKGGFWGGAEYLGTRFVDGFVSNIEGILDFAVGGVAGLIGLSGNENAQEFAEDVFRDDWYNYERADDKYNPGKGMSVLGDVAGVVGGAVPDVAIGLLTGGLGWGAKAISAGTSIASSAGRGLNEAVNTTGDLGAKEWAGGIGGGLLAGGIELISGGLGDLAGGAFGKTGVEMGSEIAESLGKRASNETIESIFNKAIGKEAAGEFSESAIGRLASNIWNSKAFRDLAGEMTSEGLEESIETWLEPFIKQNTYQPDAPNASAGDILYSGFLGAVSGGIISGSVNATNDIITTKRGATIANNNNKLTSLFDNAQAIIGYENKNDTGSQVFGAVSNMYQDIQNKLQQSGGKMTVSIMNDIGKLDALVGSAVMQPSIVNAAKGVAKNAESMAESLNRFYKQTGQSKHVTAEQLTAGLNLDGSSKDFVKSVTNALETNATLREVVLNNMFGRLQFDAKAYANSIYDDIDIRSIATQQNLNRFISSADAATLGQTGEVLGISDWASLTPEELASKIQQFRQNGGEAAFAEGVSSIREANKTKEYTKGMPGDISSLTQGATRFKVGGADFAIIRHGDSYRLYDYNTGHITKSVQMGDMNSLVARLRERAAQIGKESEMQALDREIDSFAMENVPEYKSLTAAEKEAVRATLRYAQANGISIKDQILFARIAAKSGMNIIPGKNLLKNKAAWYDGINTIYIDTTTPRTRLYSGILGHELYHKMFKSDKRRKLFNAAFKNIDQKLKDKTKDDYKKQLREEGRYTEEQIEAISDEEVAAAYAEELFNTPGVWSFILDGEPNLGERVINFFKGSPKRYDFAPEMDPAAKAWIREYKKLFDEVARFNAGENVATSVRKIERIGKLVDDSAVEGRATSNSSKLVVSIEPDAELDTLIAKSKKNKADVIRNYLIEKYNGHTFKLSDGRTAIMDKSDAKELSHKADQARTAQLGNLRELVEKAPYSHSAYNVDHNKFIDFHYYNITAKYRGSEYDLWINVGVAKNDGKNHIYSITNKKEDVPTNNGVGGPVGYHLQNTSSKRIISQNSQNSKAFDKNSAKDFKTEGRSALHDAEYAVILNKKNEVNTVREEIREIEASDDFKSVMDAVTKSVDNDDVASGIKTYEKWNKSSGYGELIARRDKLLDEITRLQNEYEEKQVSNAKNAEQEAIKKSGLSEADYFRKQAEKEFGYTPYFYDAGYILPNGKMLNFSGEKGKHYGTRGEDHRAIGIIYADTQGTKALTRFMNDGNIRIMAESPGLDIASKVEPSREQYSTIRSFIYDSINREYFNVDISDESGRVIGSLEYDGKINPTRIINDIKHYYETGEIRGQSEIDKFRYALADGNKATTSDVAASKRAIREDGIDPSGIIELADKYFDRYNGKLTRTGVRYEFLAAAETMLESREDSLDRAYQKIEALAEELTYNEKASGALAEELADVKRHIKEITFAVKDQDKGEFDNYGGFGEFRKQHFGKIKIANEGTSVDSSYGELQNLYGTNLFPDRNTAQEMLIRIAEVVDMDPTVQTDNDTDLEIISNETAVAITGELAAAFDRKLATKGEKLSKTDAEAYKGRIRAKEEARAAKAIAQAKKKFEKLEKQIREKAEKQIADAEAKANRTVETERTKLKAEYETDRVFSQAEVNKSLATVEAFKSLPKKVRDSISNQVWTAFSESNGYDSRSWLELKYTAEVVNRIIDEKDTAVTKYERDTIYEQVSAAMKQIAEGGKKSVRANMEGEIRNEITPKIKAEESTRRVILSEIYQSLKKIDDVKTARFVAASDYKGRTFKGSIEHLTKMDWRGQLNDKIVRSEMAEILKWYQPDNPMLKEIQNSELRTTMYDESIKHRLEVLAEGEGALTNTELGMLSDSLAYFTKLINEYDRVYSEGKWQSGENLVYKMRDTIEKQDKMRIPLAIKGLRNRFISGDFRAFGDPMSVMKAADMYEDGIFTRTYNDWMWGEINAQAEELSIKQEYDEFMKKNKKYLAKADKDKVKLHGVEFSRLQLVSYIMTLKRKGSWIGVLHEGVVFRDKDGRDVKMRPLVPIDEGRDFNKKLKAAINSEIALAERLMTDKDMQYLEILERGFEKAKATKAAADMQRLGFVNVVDGYYYPIRRAYTEHLSEFEAELFATDRYANASFNKKSIEKAKSALLISSADSVFNSHVKGVSRYMYLSPVMDSFNKLYKLKVLKVKPGMGADIGALYALADSTTSMQQIIAQSKTTWRQDGKIVGFDYLQNLMLDTMSSKPQAIGDDVTGWFRSNYVGFALGANPKVLLTQFSSLFASTSVLNVRSHIGGVFTNAKGVDTYSVVARLRDSDYTIAKAMSVSDNISRLSKWFTQGMSFFDRIVVKRAYAAAKVQVAQNGGPKIGTEQNSIEAGRLLDKVILETQQNAMSSRKTEAARRGNMLSKTMIMFKSDAITTMGRVIDAWGELQYLTAKNNGTEGDGKGEYKVQIKKAKKQLSRTVGAVVAGSAYMVIVSEAFKKFYGKDDEDETDEEKAKRRFGEFILNVMGGLPVISSIAEAFTSFYDFESIEFSAINDILSTAKKIGELAGDLLDGKADSRDVNRLIERLMFTAGQIFGIPTRNIKNLVYAFTRLISPETAYKWNDSLYDQSYKGDLTDALEKGDYDMAEVILELAFGDKMGSGLSDRAIAELMRLANIGEDIIPSAIGDTITIDGVERELTGEELKAVREKYGEAIDRINYIVDTDVFKSFSDETKADAVRKIYSLYKNLAYDSVLGTKKDEEAYILSKIVDPDILCLNEILTCYTSDKDEDGNTIPNSKRNKVVAAIQDMDISDEEKLLLIATHGYALKDGDVSGMSKEKADAMLYDYIAGLDISDEEKLALYKYCGYDVKDGEVSGSAASGSSSSGNGSKENGGGSTGGNSGSKKTSGGSRKSSYNASLTNPSGPLSKVTQNRVRRIGKIV